MQTKNVEEVKRVIRLYLKTTENTMSAKLALELVLKKIEELELVEELAEIADEIRNDEAPVLFRGFLGC